MAYAGVQLDRETFSCPICLDLLKDPVTIPCGHSYCITCIKNFWRENDEEDTHSCPQCRQTFTPRPGLVKNHMLVALVEQLKKIDLQDPPDDKDYAGPEDVACDVCSGRKRKALKSCLDCLVSYCEKHLNPHYVAAPLKKHRLCEVTTSLQQTICVHHNEVMKLFCCRDQQCICYLCSVNAHKGHRIVSVEAERIERQPEVEKKQEEIQEAIQKTEKDVNVLQEKTKAINLSADKATEVTDSIFTELINFILRKKSDVMIQIQFQQETSLDKAKNLEEKLKMMLNDLRRKDAEIKKLSQTDHHIHFLQNLKSVMQSCPVLRVPSICAASPDAQFYEDVMAAAMEAMGTIENILRKDWTKISQVESELIAFSTKPQAEPYTRDDFLTYLQELTLDRRLTRSPGLLHVTNQGVKTFGKTFINNSIQGWQFLSTESMIGRCYWEVERSGKCVVAVAYKGDKVGISNVSYEFGNDDRSWALECSQFIYIFKHANEVTVFSGPQSSRLGVYLDYTAGILAFYNISETMTLLHKIETTFTEPLYAGLRLFDSPFAASAEFCKFK